MFCFGINPTGNKYVNSVNIELNTNMNGDIDMNLGKKYIDMNLGKKYIDMNLNKKNIDEFK